jgi:MFS family permease
MEPNPKTRCRGWRQFLLMFNDSGQAAAGPLVGFVSDALGWRWVFGIPAFVTFSALTILVVARRGSGAVPVAV